MTVELDFVLRVLQITTIVLNWFLKGRFEILFLWMR